MLLQWAQLKLPMTKHCRWKASATAISIDEKEPSKINNTGVIWIENKINHFEVKARRSTMDTNLWLSAPMGEFRFMTILKYFYVRDLLNESQTPQSAQNLFLPKSAVDYLCYLKSSNTIGQRKTTNTEKYLYQWLTSFNLKNFLVLSWYL